MQMNKVELLIWKSESKNYIVAHPIIDIISQGRTQEEAYKSFLETLALETLYKIKEDGTVKFPLTPPNVLKEYKQKAEQFKRTLS